MNSNSDLLSMQLRPQVEVTLAQIDVLQGRIERLSRLADVLPGHDAMAPARAKVADYVLRRRALFKNLGILPN